MAMAPEPPLSTGLHQLRHDLLNPLNVLVGACGALGGTDLSDAQRAWVRMIESAARRAARHHRQPRVVSPAARAGWPGPARRSVLDRRRAGGQALRSGATWSTQSNASRDADRCASCSWTIRRSSPRWCARTCADTGWELDVVETGERAVAQATTERYDVVLMDIDLPGLDGATAAHAIRAADLARGVSPTPIIAMTAFDPDSSSAAAPRAAGGQSPCAQRRGAHR